MLTLTFLFLLLFLTKKKIVVSLWYSSYQPGREPASFRGRHFYACPDASYGGFVPPCGVLMHPLPGWWRVTGKAEPLLFH